MRFASLRARVLAAVGLGFAAITMVLFSVVPMVHSGHYQLAAHTALLFVVAVLLLVGALAQFRSGFSSFVPLRANLLAVREGGARRIDGRYPSTRPVPLPDSCRSRRRGRSRPSPASHQPGASRRPARSRQPSGSSRSIRRTPRRCGSRWFPRRTRAHRARGDLAHDSSQRPPRVHVVEDATLGHDR